MKQIISVLASALLFAGCSHFKSNEEVSKEQMARVPPQNMASVNQARVNLAKAEDEVARQQLGVNSAKEDAEESPDGSRSGDDSANTAAVAHGQRQT